MLRSISAIALVLTLCLWATIVPERALVPVPLGLLAIAAWLLASTKSDEARRVAPTLGASALRSILGAVVLEVGTEIAGAQSMIARPSGFGSLDVPKYIFVAAGISLGLSLGPIAVFEHHAATRPGRSSALLATGLAAWASFVALFLGWLEASYVNAMTAAQGTQAALGAVQDAGSLLLESPLWTLEHLGWCALPVGAVTWSRLRGWSLPGQVTLGLAVSGAAREIFPGKVPLVTWGLAGLSIALPIVFLAADAIAKRLARAASSPPEQEAPSRWPWIVAVTLCALSFLPLLGRELERARSRSALAARAREALARWRPMREGHAANDLRARAEVLEREAAPLVSAIDAIPASATAAEVAPLLAKVSSLEGRARALQDDTRLPWVARWKMEGEARELFSRIRENGGGPTEEDQHEIESAWTASNVELGSLRDTSIKASLLLRRIHDARLRLEGHGRASGE